MIPCESFLVTLSLLLREKGTKRSSWRQICSTYTFFFSHFALACELHLVVGDIAEAKAMSFVFNLKTRFKQLEKCYSVASRVCGK